MKATRSDQCLTAASTTLYGTTLLFGHDCDESQISPPERTPSLTPPRSSGFPHSSSSSSSSNSSLSSPSTIHSQNKVANKYFPFLAALRILATLHVTSYFFYSATTNSHWNTLASWGLVQLPLFFLLSGFLLTIRYKSWQETSPSAVSDAGTDPTSHSNLYSTSDSASDSSVLRQPPNHKCPKASWVFFLDRLVKIYPLYLIAILISIFQIVHSASLRTEFTFSFTTLLPIVLPLQPWIKDHHDILPVNPPADIIGAFLFCYFFAPVGHSLIKKASSNFRVSVLLPFFWVLTAWNTALENDFVRIRITVIDRIPLAAHIPAFFMGIVLGIEFLDIYSDSDPPNTFSSRALPSSSSCSSSSSSSFSSLVKVLLTAFCAVLFLAFITVLPEDSPFYAFLVAWSKNGLYLPLVALIVWSSAATEMSSRIRPAHLELTKLSSWSYQILKFASQLTWPWFLFQMLVWRFLNERLCISRAQSGIQAALRVAGAFTTTTVTATTWSVCASSNYTDLVHYGFWKKMQTYDLRFLISPLVFLPALLLFSIIVRFGIQLPLTSILQKLLLQYRNSLYTPGSKSPDSSSLLLKNEKTNNGKNSNNISNITPMLPWISTLYSYKPVKLIWYYSFMSFTMYFSFTRLYNAPNDTPWFTKDLTASLFTRLAVIFAIVFVVGGMFPMLFGLIGHILYPCVVRADIPSITSLLNNTPSLSLKTHHDDQHEDDHGNHGDIPSFRLFFRIVTRGLNPILVANNVERAATILTHSPLPDTHWIIEVVTDNALNLNHRVSCDVHEIVVPSSYRTRTDAKYKARALNYAIENSLAGDMDWIIHLDEETQFDRTTLRHIYHHCCTETQAVVRGARQYGRIGQGPVMYGSGEIVNVFTTLGDSFRVADDFGKFRLQFESGEAFVGMHGSFVVCSNAVERRVTFDHGIEGSITEDAYFALLARQTGVGYRWIDSFMYEQSPFTVSDYVKQRSRWLGGLLRVCLAKQIHVRLRLILSFMVLLWVILPITYVSVLFWCRVDGSGKAFQLLTVSLRCVSSWYYLLGFVMTYRLEDGLSRYLMLLYLQLLFQPLYGLLETWGVIYTFVHLHRVTTGFHIVIKENNDHLDKVGSVDSDPEVGTTRKMLLEVGDVVRDKDRGIEITRTKTTSAASPLGSVVTFSE